MIELYALGAVPVNPFPEGLQAQLPRQSEQGVTEHLLQGLPCGDGDTGVKQGQGRLQL